MVISNFNKQIKYFILRAVLQQKFYETNLLIISLREFHFDKMSGVPIVIGGRV